MQIWFCYITVNSSLYPMNKHMPLQNQARERVYYTLYYWVKNDKNLFSKKIMWCHMRT